MIIFIVERQSQDDLKHHLFTEHIKKECPMALLFHLNGYFLYNEEYQSGERFETIVDRYSDATFIVVSSGHRFLSPKDGRLSSYGKGIAKMKKAYLLTSIGSDSFGYYERELSQYFRIFPATIQTVDAILTSGKAEMEWDDMFVDLSTDAPTIRVLRQNYNTYEMIWIALCVIKADNWFIKVKDVLNIGEWYYQETGIRLDPMDLTKLSWFRGAGISKEDLHSLSFYMEERHPELFNKFKLHFKI